MQTQFEESTPGGQTFGREAVILKAVLGLAIILVIVSISAPILKARGNSGPAVYLYGIGGLLCHQKPERSFHLRWPVRDEPEKEPSEFDSGNHKPDLNTGGSNPLAVCARDFGLYIGLLCGSFFLLLVWPRLKSWRHLSNVPFYGSPMGTGIVMLVLLAPITLDLIAPWYMGIAADSGFYSSSNWTRAFTGFLAGIALCVWTAKGLQLAGTSK